MEQSDRYLASLTVEGRYRLLIEAVTDYAIFMLNSLGYRDKLESRRGEAQGLPRQ